MSNSSLSELNNPEKPDFKQSDNHFQFNKWLLSTVAILILIIVGFNLIVDPYGIYKSPNFLGINHEKPKKKFN